MNSAQEVKTILYASDLGEHTRPVFRQAIYYARSLGAKIIMLHVIKPMTPMARTVLNTYAPDVDMTRVEQEGMKEVIAKMRKRLQKACEEEGEICGADESLIANVEVRTGLPSEAILHSAIEHKADLIVMGSCSESILGYHILGSTAHKVSQHSKIPVLVVPNSQR